MFNLKYLEIMKTEFYAFLIKHKAAKRFVMNFASNRQLRNTKLALEDYLDRCYPASYVCSPFVWAGTEEGEAYWQLLDAIWCNECRSN